LYFATRQAIAFVCSYWITFVQCTA